jgi:hypothetical protein
VDILTMVEDVIGPGSNFHTVSICLNKCPLVAILYNQCQEVITNRCILNR